MPRVLLVNTQPHLRSLLEKRFAQEGFDVLVASWEDSLASAFERAADLVVLGQDGEHRLGEWVAAKGPLSVPLIFLATSDSDGAESEAAPAVAQLKMPFRPSQLVALARKAVLP
jgi:DNA-binding response OmpR family regulator